MDKRTKVILIVVIIFVITNISALVMLTVKSVKDNPIDMDFVNEIQLPSNGKKPNKIKFPEDALETYIQINPTEEFDYFGTDYIFKSRKWAVERNKEFFGGTYHPSEEVFGQIVPNKPWWGVKGLACRGIKDTTAGDSEESRFINNPMLLIAVDTNWAWQIDKWNCGNIYPEPILLKVIPAKNTIEVTYSVSKFDKLMRRHIVFASGKEEEFKYYYQFYGLNARDFGYDYVLAKEQNNIEFKSLQNPSTMVYKFKNYIHTGGSCRVDGGCNNGSPNQPELHFGISNYPASITFYLYKEEPQLHKKVPEFLIYKIYFE